MNKKDLLNRNLPKWPQMHVTGKPVTIEQAKEIIRRTDIFFQNGGGFCGGNNHEYTRRIISSLGMTPFYLDIKSGNWSQFSSEGKRFKDEWGYIDTNYVFNKWVSSDYIEGPCGWCHPDGTIGFIDNIGKWPKCEEVLKDWETLAKEFTFLNLGITLMNDEHCEENIQPIISFVVENGKVYVKDPTKLDVHRNHEKAIRGNQLDEYADEDSKRYKEIFSKVIPDGSRSIENGIPDEWINAWAKKYTEEGCHNCALNIGVGCFATQKDPHDSGYDDNRGNCDGYERKEI
jgi:hypothetical protein